MKKDWQDHIFNWKVRIAVPVLFFAAASWVDIRYIYTRPVVFESSAKMWIQTKIANQQSPFFNSPIATAAEVMKSSVVLDEAIKDLKKVLPEAAIPDSNSLRGGVQIVPLSDTDIVNVSFQNRDPKVAFEVVNCVIHAFVRVNVSQTAATAVQSRVFLEKQLASSKKQHENITRLKQQFQESKSLDVGKDSNQLFDRVSALTSQLLDLQISLKTTQTQIRTLTAQLRMSPESALVIHTFTQDDVLNRLRERLSEQIFNLEETKTKVSPDSPRLTRSMKSIDKTKVAINERYKLLYGKPMPLSIDELPKGRDDKRVELQDTLAAAQQREIIEKQRITEIQSTISSLNSQLRALPVVQSEFTELNRAERVTTDTISTAEKELSVAQMNEAIAQESSNVQIIDLPEMATRPESAGGKKIFAIVESLLLAASGVLFYLLTFLDPHLYSARRFTKLLAAPIVGVIPKSKTGKEGISPLHRLRINVQDWIGSEPVVVLGPGRAAGSTSVACGLAVSYANTGKRVALLDANFANPSLSKMFGLEASSGLANFTETGNISILENACTEVQSNLIVIPAGYSETDCIIERDYVEKLLHYLKKRADIIIFDAAPVTSDSALSLLAEIKKVIVVARLGYTRIAATKHLSSKIASKEADPVAVLTNATESDVLSVAKFHKPNSESLLPSELTALW